MVIKKDKKVIGQTERNTDRQTDKHVCVFWGGQGRVKYIL